MPNDKIAKIRIPDGTNMKKLSKQLKEEHGITVVSVGEATVMDAEDEHYRQVRDNIARNHHLDFTNF